MAPTYILIYRLAAKASCVPSALKLRHILCILPAAKGATLNIVSFRWGSVEESLLGAERSTCATVQSARAMRDTSVKLFIFKHEDCLTGRQKSGECNDLRL